MLHHFKVDGVVCVGEADVHAYDSNAEALALTLGHEVPVGNCVIDTR